jgi:hypothetical protein
MNALVRGIMVPVSSDDRFEIEWHWEGDLQVAALPDGTVVRSSATGATALRDKVVAVLAERGITARYLYFRQVDAKEQRRTPRRRVSRPTSG